MYAQSYDRFFLVVYMFLTLISRDDRNFRMQLNFIKSCTPIPDFFGRASAKDREMEYQWKHQKTEKWFTNGDELGFSKKLFKKNNINMPQLSF